MRHVEKSDKGKQWMDGEDMHSEKVRRILGDMPRSLTVWGLVVMAAVFIVLLAAVCLLPYPYADRESILEHLLGCAV